VAGVTTPKTSGISIRTLTPPPLVELGQDLSCDPRAIVDAKGEKTP
jgi:hypothetical protein